MLNLYINRWTLSLICVVIGVVLSLIGLPMVAQIGVPIVISFIILSGASRSEDAKTMSYLSGMMIGIAGLFNVYSLAAAVILIIYMYTGGKAKSLKVFWSLLFGMLTPGWLLLPVFLYYNQQMLVSLINSI